MGEITPFLIEHCGRSTKNRLPHDDEREQAHECIRVRLCISSCTMDDNGADFRWFILLVNSV
ncbi:MAG: hypothetical protein WC620_08965 [Methanoregula sp.]